MRRRATTRRLRRSLLGGVALFAVAMVVLLDVTNAFDRAELSTVDTRFEIRGERPVPKDVVVVGIDDVTFSELRERFPFSRLRFARGLDPKSKEGELALLFLRAYRSLDALLGGDDAKARLWLRAENDHLDGIPADRIRTVEGLVDVVQYLDAMRGRL